VFGVSLADEAAVRAFLAQQAVPCAAPRNAAEHLMANIGRTLTDLFFRPYTKKMWAMDLEELDAAVVKRIPIRYDDEDRYFPSDAFQMMPADGYTALIGAILDHPSISVRVGEAFDRAMRRDFAHCFNSMPIDEYFDFALGPLPYRSIRFHHAEHDAASHRAAAATVNFTDDGPFTRETDWSQLPLHLVADRGTRLTTREEPCDYTENAMERFYPIKTSDGRYDRAYAAYKELAAAEPGLTFIGRCGTYQYLDMHQVINQSLHGVRQWLEQQGVRAA
jgi:UDP-galactopyranose mutase